MLDFIDTANEIYLLRSDVVPAWAKIWFQKGAVVMTAMCNRVQIQTLKFKASPGTHRWRRETTEQTGLETEI